MTKGKKILLTVLIVAEGFCDKAFVECLKRLYVPRNCGVTAKVKNAKGKGSNNVVKHAITIREGYDIKVAFYDADVTLTHTNRKKATSKNIRLIASKPCLEGLLLKILDKPVLNPCSACKTAFYPLLTGKDPTEPDSYSIFSKEKLEAKRSDIPELDQLLNALEGK